MSALPEKVFCSVAKASLFSAPVVSYLVKTMEAIPVAKADDGDMKLTAEERKKTNQLMFDTTKSRLMNGRNIVIFPEGTCHSSPTIKSLKIGTAKMAFEVALNNGPRIPIVPLGLSYSSPSGNEFRGSVLVDVGRPINLTDEQVERYERGDRGARYELCSELTEKIERRLRDCTIRVPNWIDQLEHHNPSFEKITNDIDSTYTVVCTVGDKTFASSAASLSNVRAASELKLEAAKGAFFSLNGASQSTKMAEVIDQDFVEQMHLARRIYKPHDVSLNLAQYASLTRNFMKIALKHVHSSRFQQIWADLSDYREALKEVRNCECVNSLNITDKYVSSHSKGSDPVNERLNKLRTGAKRDVVKLAFFGPLSLVGTVLHSPIIAMAFQAGQIMGIEKHTGDISVVATMRLLTAFTTTCIAYPTAAAASTYFYGAPAGAAAIPFLSLSAYAAIKYPVFSAVSSARGSYTLLTQKDSVDRLRDTRASLQHRIREWSDEHAPEPEMVGWWKDPNAGVERIRMKQKVRSLEERSDEQGNAIFEIMFEKHLLEQERIVKLGSFEAAEMRSLSIKLAKNKRQENERAVLTFKQDDENRKCLLWIPGRNDSFFHVHVLQRFLDVGFDVYALDMRRSGRAKVGDDGNPAVEDRFAHDSYDFREYFEEIDATMKFLKNPNKLVGDDEMHLQDGGCGKVYDGIVMYAHSTGALVAGQYATGGAWRGAIDGYIFNSPFWSWNLSPLQKSAVQNAHKAGLPDSFVIDEGGAPNDYSLSMEKRYNFTKMLKSSKNLATTVGWCKAVTLAQEELKSGNMVLDQPCLVLSSTSDEVLDAGDIDRLSDFLVVGRQDGKDKSLEDTGAMLVERVIESTVREKSGHDVLAADSAVKVDEAMTAIEKWLIGRYGFRMI
ncbi:hypothetical protein TL16_g09028 [Triparma laevis f. inornata]|uniref:Phospholipid/glycerol acyltransferase domain-containing protein n=1 Tax=Triparma laevis f. inornata TaxID=1714386 RepID=A0A9W7B8F0_9STRA|nr:hypothetical protein TL16_g09028 [Triparma laevis f. inornata]